jgi:hypothetical protein
VRAASRAEEPFVDREAERAALVGALTSMLAARGSEKRVLEQGTICPADPDR